MMRRKLTSNNYNNKLWRAVVSGDTTGFVNPNAPESRDPRLRLVEVEAGYWIQNKFRNYIKIKSENYLRTYVTPLQFTLFECKCHSIYLIILILLLSVCHSKDSRVLNSRVPIHNL